MSLKGGKENRNYDKSKQELFNITITALEELNFTIKEKSGSELIKAASKLNLLSTGSNITIFFEQDTDQKTSITITAETKGITLIDYGRGGSEIKKIFETIESRLNISPVPDKICPSCQKAVNQEDNFCEHCGAKL